MSPTERMFLERLDGLSSRLSAIEARLARAEGRRAALLAAVGVGGGGLAGAVQWLLPLLTGGV